MFAQNLLLPAFAVFSTVAAQTSCGTASATITLNAAADFTQYADCTTLKGSVLVSNNSANTMNLDGPEEITGDIIVTDASNLLTLSSSSIKTIGGTMKLTRLTTLSTIQFTELSKVGGLLWDTLPVLSSPTFPSFITTAGSVVITNTFINDLSGIALKTVGVLNINNNGRLSKFTSAITGVTGSLTFAANSQALEVEFPNLLFAQEATFRNISKLTVPSLTKVNGSLNLDESFMEGFSTPNLTSVGDFTKKTGSLSFIGNSLLTNITLANLKTVGGGISVANNTELNSVSMPALSQVGGAIVYAGNFTSFDLSGLTNVQGAVNIQSTAELDCSTIDKDKTSGVIQGSKTCKGKVDDLNPLGGSATSGTSSSSTGKGAAGSTYSLNMRSTIGMSVVGGLLGLLV